MTTFQTFEQLATAYSDEPRIQHAHLTGLCEAHIRSQDQTIAILEEEIRQIINQLNKEQS